MSEITDPPAEVTAAIEIIMREEATDSGSAADIIRMRAEANGLTVSEVAAEIVRVDGTRSPRDS